MPAKHPAKMRRWHHQLLMMILLFPERSQRELAMALGRSEAWVSTVINSDLFQANLAKARIEVDSPVLCSAQEKAAAVMSMGLDRLAERMGAGADKTAVIADVVGKMNGILHPTLGGGKGVPPNLHLHLTPRDLEDAQSILTQGGRRTARYLEHRSDAPATFEGGVAHVLAASCSG